LKSLGDVAALMGDQAFPAQADGDAIAAARINADPKNSNVYVVTLTQAGLGMPNRDYYLKTDDAGVNATREAYKKYLVTMLGLSGATKDVAPRAAAVRGLGRAARRRQDLQPDDGGGAGEVRARLRLGRVLQGAGHRRRPQAG